MLALRHSLNSSKHRLAFTIRHFSSTRSHFNEIEIFVDNVPVKIPQGVPIIQACEQAGKSIPRFCYHDRLSIAGNCRMCLVEVEKSPKPVASCAMPAMPGMKIFTDTPLVKKAREGVMEFLLANHPLDCPICDQGGECDLQDQSVRYGHDRGRFQERVGKRAVEDKNLGPLVKTVMTRCIQCTRCVRFAYDVAGCDDLGTTGRGNDMQIGTYVEKTINSEMSGNLIDLCPVGALTSKPYAFTARPWELTSTESIDVMDAVGSNIRIDTRGLEVMRVLPRVNEDINEEWISDKTRFAYDGLKRQRLTVPMIMDNGQFQSTTWKDALEVISENLAQVKGKEIAVIAGQHADAESLLTAKDLFCKVGCNQFEFESSNGNCGNKPAYGADWRSCYTFNSTIANVDESDAILLIGTNPRHEAAIINTRIRKAFLRGAEVALIGPSQNFNYNYHHLGDSINAINEIIAGNGEFAKVFKSAKRPVVIVGHSLLEQVNGFEYQAAINMLLAKFKSNIFQKDWNGYNILQQAAGRTAALDIGFIPSSSKTKPKFIYLLGADNINAEDIPSDAFVVYQGSHGDHGASFANVVLPGCAYTEKAGTYVNVEGRVQQTRAAVSPPGAAREDWKILRALSEVAGKTLPYDDIHELRERMEEVAPQLNRIDVLESSTTPEHLLSAIESVKVNSSTKVPIEFKDFYLSSPISRASSTMAKCSAAFSPKVITDKVSLNQI